MYDRKTWIGLILCSLGLVAHLHFSSKNKVAQREAQLAEKKAQAELVEKAPAGTALPNSSGNPTPESTTTANSAPQIPAQTHILTTPDTSFHFTNKGGGLAYTELKNQTAVHDAKTKIKINGISDIAIGALGTTPDTYIENNLKVLGSSKKSITYGGVTSTGITVRKHWELLDAQETGAPYRLKLTLTLKNPDAAASSVNISTHNLFLGTAAPLYQKEWDNQTIWCYRADNDFNQEHSNWFKGGFFGKSKSLYEEHHEQIEYAGVSNQFFLSTLQPKEPYNGKIWAKSGTAKITKLAGGGPDKKNKSSIRSGLYLPDQTLSPGETRTLEYSLFTGPKENALIRKLKTGEAMNYGIFGFISNVLNRLMNVLHNIFGGDNAKYAWGLAIIFVTVILRIILWPLHNKSQRTMKRMSKLKPKMDELREKYGDDPNKMNQKTMALYRDFGVNPMGGCLPMFLQIPIFFGFYKMLQYAVELRGQEFLWVKDLSQPDTIHTFDLPFSLPLLGTELPINLLPILMAVSMFFQMRLTPTTGDKMQQKIFMFMPFMFFFFCYNFAAALALYWTTQNIFQIGQTLLMKRLPEPELKAKKKGKGLMQKLQEKAEMAQKQRDQMGKNQSSSGQPQKPKKPRGPKTGG